MSRRRPIVIALMIEGDRPFGSGKTVSPERGRSARVALSTDPEAPAPEAEYEKAKHPAAY